MLKLVRSARTPMRCLLRLGRRLRQGGLRNPPHKRVGKIRLSDLLKPLVDSDGRGWPSRMHDQHDGLNGAAAGIAAIAFADADHRVVIGVGHGPGMHFQFMRGVSSPI